MIISKKNKFIFIAHASSGGTAIMNELIENYDGETIYHKHCNYPSLQLNNEIENLDDYFVFAVIRDPIDKTFSEYNKIKSNANNQYTNPDFFYENGGTVSKKMRKVYNKVKQLKSFNDYIKYRYSYRLYHDDVTINAPYLNGYIRFNSLSNDFSSIMNHLGISVKRDLPLINKTNKLFMKEEIEERLKNKSFGPYYFVNNHLFKNSYEIKTLNYLIFYYKILSKIRKRRVINNDQRFIKEKRGLNHK